jgi:hypothetical protein
VISPVIVEIRKGVSIARCVSPACGGGHLLHGGNDPRAAEKAADDHLKKINRAGT